MRAVPRWNALLCQRRVEIAGSTCPRRVPASSALDVYGNVHIGPAGLPAVDRRRSPPTRTCWACAIWRWRRPSPRWPRPETNSARRPIALQGFAVSEYVSSGLVLGRTARQQRRHATAQPEHAAGLGRRGGTAVPRRGGQQSADQVTTRPRAPSRAPSNAADAAAKALAQAAVTLTSDQAAENQDLTQLIKDVATLEHAGACATVTIMPPRRPRRAGTTGYDHHDHRRPDDDHDGPADTTTTTVPPTTTTTTSPPTTTRRRLTSRTTTTTTVPPTTTHDDRAPDDRRPRRRRRPRRARRAPSTTTAPPAEAAGVAALQGCIASFAPPSGT